jgi:hypothetical protein
LVTDVVLIGWYVPSSDLELQGVGILIEAALPALDSLASRLLA